MGVWDRDGVMNEGWGWGLGAGLGLGYGTVQDLGYRTGLGVQDRTQGAAVGAGQEFWVQDSGFGMQVRVRGAGQDLGLRSGFGVQHS